MTDDERQAALVAAYALPLEDPVARWRREADELAARRARAQEELRQTERAAASQPPELDPFLVDILAGVVAEERKLMRAEIQEAIGELRAEFNVMRSIDKGRVVDLPALPRRRA